ncbi:MAG: D-aminoacyl-tRNA deacylase [Bacteroidota bacterium]
MRAVIQRVSKASVKSREHGENLISAGLLVLLGIEEADCGEDVAWLCNKIARLRIFSDERGVMNHSVMDIKGELLVVSQFTLHAGTKKGNRPSYIKAARPEQAIPLYERFIDQLHSESGLEVKSGWFGANMQVELINDGPVTILIDSRNRE